ncbi:MAG: hypothetical protein WCQ11_07235, partial [Actinomycetes bacterium]
MANAMRKMAEYLGLVDGGEFSEEYAEYAESSYEQYEEQVPVRPVASPMTQSYDRVVAQVETAYVA